MGASTADIDIRRESLISAASNVVLVVVHLGTLGLLTRALGADGVGTYFYAISASFIAIIPSRELSQIMRKRVSEVDSPSAEYFGLAQAGTAAYLLVFGAALLALSSVLARETPLTASSMLAFGVYTAVLTQSAMSTRLYDAVGSPGASMVAQSARETAFFGGVVALIALGTASPSSVLLLGAGVHLLAALGIYVLVGLVPRAPSRESLRRGFEFGKWSFPTGVASHVWKQTPTLLMGVLLGGPAVALYETAKRVTMVGSYLATCINDPLLVKASGVDSAGEEVLRYVELALDYTPSVAIPAVFLVAPVATEVLLAAAGSEYAAGGPVLVGVAAIHVLSGLKTPISAALHGIDEPKYVFYLTAASLTVGAPAVVGGALGGGITGVVLALVALELGGVLVAEVAAYHAFGRLVLPNTLHVQIAAGTVGGGFVWAASHALDVSAVSTLSVVLAAGATIHFGLFALASEGFREGTVRTVRDATRFVHSATPH